MATKNKDQEIVEDTAAADSIKMKPSDASKASMMATAMGAMAGMDSAACSKWLDQALALIGHEGDAIPDDAAAKNAASIAMKGAVQEDVTALFGSEELSEEFKEKTTILFEAAVNARVLAESARLEEAYEEKLNEEIETIVESLGENINQYLTYVAEEWASENQVAIDRSIRTDIAESFITGLHTLFNEHWATVPEDKVDVVEALATKVEDLTDKLNEQMKTNIDLNTLVEGFTKESVLHEVSAGLALTQADKLKTLAENVDFESVESYKKKLTVIKENFLNSTSKTVKPTSFITEEIEVDAPEAVYLEPQIASYAQAISRTTKK